MSHRKLLKTPLKIHGGKSYLADWIIQHFPPRDTWHLYREPFFGGGSVLLRLDPEGLSEAVNDLDKGLTDFWDVLAQTPDRMLRELWATPLSDHVWDAAEAQLAHSDRVRRATAFFIRARQSRQGLRKDFATPTRRLRRGMNENVSAWLSAVEGLPDIHERLKRVEIRNLDAVAFIQRYDDPEALFYCDPPYLHSTRTVPNAYAYEMTEAQHNILLACLSEIKGRFVLSGYPSELYEGWAKLHNYRCIEKQIDNKAGSGDTKRQMTECLWVNY